MAKWASRIDGRVVRIKTVGSDDPFESNDANYRVLAVTLLAKSVHV